MRTLMRKLTTARPRAETVSSIISKRTRTRDTLPSILNKLSPDRSLTPAGYTEIIRLASEYTSRRSHSDTSLGWEIAQSAIQDAEASNFTLDISRYLYEPSLLPTLLITSPPSIPMYTALAHQATISASPEQCAYILREMLNREYAPSAHFVQRTIELCCEWSYPRLALQLAQRLELASSRVDTSAWAQILICSAESQFLDGVESAWNRVIPTRRYTPDEGLLLRLLDVAARWGRPDLATKYLDLLQSTPREHHFVPLLEAFVNAGQVPEAIQVLSTMRAAGLTPTLRTAEPIASALSSADLIDQAFYAMEDLPSGTVDITALNALILASARLGDLQRVRATQTAASDLGIQPDVDTFNITLSGCIAAEHRALGDTLLDEMRSAGLQPNATTYERMIHLCLVPAQYEDAFYYLEKLKAEGHSPPYSVYRAILVKCIESGDKRWRLVIEEVETLGHWIDKEMQTLLQDASAGGRGRVAMGRAGRD